MSQDDPIDLAHIDPPIWRIKVDGTIYGPYTQGQMRALIGETRLSPYSEVAVGENGTFKPAVQHVTLANLFNEDAASPEKSSTKQKNHLVVHNGSPEARLEIIKSLNELGLFVEVMDGVFLLNSPNRILDIKSQLAEACDASDRVLVVNAEDSRLAWFGMDHDMTDHIHTVWKT